MVLNYCHLNIFNISKIKGLVVSSNPSSRGLGVNTTLLLLSLKSVLLMREKLRELAKALLDF